MYNKSEIIYNSKICVIISLSYGRFCKENTGKIVIINVDILIKVVNKEMIV